MRGPLCVALSLWLSAGYSERTGWAQPPQRYEQTQVHMGVAVHIIAYSADDQSAAAAMSAAFEIIAQIDAQMSDYRDDSELSLLASAPANHWVNVSPTLYDVLSTSRCVSCKTGGAFDVTVGPASQLWRRARETQAMPPRQRLIAASRQIGFQKLSLHPCRYQVCFQTDGMRLDLGGVAKGFAADQAKQKLADFGVTQVLIDAGGDIALGDPPPGKPGWAVGIDAGSKPAPPQFVMLSQCGVATSGDARQFVVIDGQRYSHIVDPRTSIGLTQSSSVTVIAPTSTLADAYASALSVMGPDKAIRFVNQSEQLAARMVYQIRQHEFEVDSSDNFPQVKVIAPAGKQ